MDTDMRFQIRERTLREALKRYDASRRMRYGEGMGFDFTNPGHVSRVLGVAIENQISLNLFGKPSSYTDRRADTDGGWDLEIGGRMWDIKANNVENHGSWLIDYKKGVDNRPDDLLFLCCNGTLGADYEHNRTYTIEGWISMGELRQMEPKWYKFGRYYNPRVADLNPFDDFSKL